MITRSFDNTLRGKFHSLELEKNGNENPIIYDNGKLPITFLETFKLLVTPTNVLIKDSNDLYYDVLHSNSELTVKLEVGQLKVVKGSAVVTGSNLNLKQSPAPICYVDSEGAINSVVASDSIWSESVMGYTADGKPNTYSQGFVRDGSANHESLFLRKDGNWGQPSIYTGSVSENFLSLEDTPSEYNNNLDKYLRVSYAEGGSIVFDAIDTSKIPENNNLYYTEKRVEDKIIQKTSDRSLNSISVVNSITAKDFFCDSDKRLKYNIKSLNPFESLKIIENLNPVSYKFKNTNNIRYGFISQEVKEIIPAIVKTENDLEKINYLDIISFLVSSVKELKKEIDLLKGISNL